MYDSGRYPRESPTIGAGAFDVAMVFDHHRKHKSVEGDMHHGLRRNSTLRAAQHALSHFLFVLS